MKWFGEHIWPFKSRFRNDVIIEKDKSLYMGTELILSNSGTTTTLSNIDAIDSDTIATLNTALTAGDITGVTITTDSGGGSAASDTSGSADFSILGTSGVGVTNSGTTITATSVPGEIDHDSLLNFASNEHFTQANITTVGTIDTGVWNGDVIASTYLDADTAHLSGIQTFTGRKTFTATTLYSGNKDITASTDGAVIHVDQHDIRDVSTSLGGTAALFTHVNIERPRLQASNANVTTTAAATLYINDAPLAGYQMAITNPYALWVDAGLVKFDGALTVDGAITGDLTGNADTATSAATVTASLQPNIEGIGTDGDTLTILSDYLIMNNASAGAPSIWIKTTNTTKDQSGELRFQKDAADTEDGEDLGKITFYGENEAPANTQFAEIKAEIQESDASDEAGKLTLSVANDGTLRNGITMTADKGTAAEVDVTIANGAASTTTIAGDLIVTGSDLTFDSITMTGIQTSGESFSDDDVSLMTSGAIADLVGTGPITGVTIQTDSGAGAKAVDTLGSADFSLLGGDGIGITNSGTTITANLDATLTTVTSMTNNNLNIGYGEEAQITFAETGFTYTSDGAARLVVTDDAWAPTNNHISFGTDSRRWQSGYFEELISTNGIFSGAVINTAAVYPASTAHNVAGNSLIAAGGSTTAGTTNNIAGGDLIFHGGQGKGSGAGGDIVFKTANAGSSGSSLNSLVTALTISDDLSATFAGGIAGTLTTVSQPNITTLAGVDSIGTAGDTLAVLSTTTNITNSTSAGPYFNVKNVHSGTTSTPLINLYNTKAGGAGTTSDILGQINWYGQNDASQEQLYGRIYGIPGSVADGSESGNLVLQVANYDGALGNGIIIGGSTSVDNTVNVTLGLGASSVTTTAADLAVNGDIDLAGDMDVDGTLETDALTIGGVTIPGTSGRRYGSTIKILPSDFMGNQDSLGSAIHWREAGNGGIVPGDANTELFAFVTIPEGMTATAVIVHSNSTARDVFVYEGDVNANWNNTSLGDAKLGTAITGLDVDATATNYLVIKVDVSNLTTQRIYGGLVTIAPQ